MQFERKIEIDFEFRNLKLNNLTSISLVIHNQPRNTTLGYESYKSKKYNS
jgi:hypothetical protein